MKITAEIVGKTLDFLRNRKGAYRAAFMNPAGEAVLEDLATFCRANETTFNADDRAAAMLEGRRQVWLRIQQHLGLTSEQLLVLYSGNQIDVIKEDE